MTRVLLFAALALLPMLVMAQVQMERPPIELNEPQEARYRALLPDLRCLVCQNESIADSTAPLALDLRYQVRQQLAAGRSDAEVKHWLTDRYGEFVLFRPSFAPHNWALWTAPFLLLLAVLAVVVIRLRRRARDRDGAAAIEPDAEALRRLLDRQTDGP